MDWYEEYIEEPSRDIVKLLRNNGFNTTCSCGHDMYVENHFIIDGEIKRLDDLLFNNGYRNYEITVWIKRVDGYVYPGLKILFGQKS